MGALPGRGLAQENAAPMSAIDWLSDSVNAPQPAPRPLPPAEPRRSAIDEPPVADTAATPTVTVSALDTPSPDAIGLLGPSITGLPVTLWSGSAETVLVPLVGAAAIESLPAVQDLLVTLMLAEAAAPAGAGPEGALFLARVDKLLDMGALDPALALLSAANPETPILFRRFFDVSLLTGTEDQACAMMRDQPGLAPTFPARIFCLARNGDWQAAVLTLGTARALGQITGEEDHLLSVFLDPALQEEAGLLPPPSRPSPLVFRIREAIGEPLQTARLPLAFAHADLRDTVAWRNQMAAAERLVRTGALEENILQALYTARRPSATGGIYERARAFQRFDAAMGANDTEAVAEALPETWNAIEMVDAEVAFARLYGAQLAGMDLVGQSARLANRITMLSPDYRAAAEGFAPVSAEERIWQAVALGETEGIEGNDRQSSAVLAAFQGGAVPEPMATEIANGRLGEALLRSLSLVQQALEGDSAAMTDALAVLLAAQLDDTARRAALQYLILDRGQ